MVYFGLMVGSVSYMVMDVSVGVVYRVMSSVTIGVVVWLFLHWDDTDFYFFNYGSQIRNFIFLTLQHAKYTPKDASLSVNNCRNSAGTQLMKLSVQSISSHFPVKKLLVDSSEWSVAIYMWIFSVWRLVIFCVLN